VDRQLTVTMVLPSHPARLAASMNPAAPAALYSCLAMLAHMLAMVAPGSRWTTDLDRLLAETPNLNVALMGFPADWRTRPVWTLP
jgi:hypothetical protein